ncbi:putative AP-3 adaptor complex subunit mu [Aspergillus glaucus CBS 516.65]|uniref:MHD domain-containing protein n=1 Tax=Aspergillus glaucus CBS 516.65 TaxID=1160497 RepID=A0A1L9VG39_ASPGL|nr:hypothetical protein ASPGLDRAFT_174601 [Aspergillus glaucus CBS 516.65]OJJ82897.1 hypothetical protein ASPGLDRAFT_174601 [Aspergillus glaucus CBS 516.65]
MSGEIDALYIYDEHNQPLVEHVYRSRPPSAATLRPLYFAHPAPRPSLLYFPSTSPPVTVFSVVQSNLLFLAVSEVDTEPLLALEFLHRVVDVLEEFVGAPLISTKIQSNYDVVAQLLHEMCDGGLVCNTELNALQEVVDVPGWMGKLLGGVGSSSSAPSLGGPNSLKPPLSSAASQGPAILWRRPNVRHTSNEIYVDIIESLSVTIAPSGRLLSALVSGTIAFTAKMSGIPDLLLSLTTPGGQQAIGQKVDLPVFHPSVRLARWRERPGDLSFVPPDGRFILAGYGVDLLPIDPDLDEPPSHMEKVFLPAFVDMRKSLGPTGSEFEVRLTLNTSFPGVAPAARPGAGRAGSGTSTPSFLGGAGGGTPSAPVLDEVVVTVPIPQSVRNITDMQASRGEAIYNPGSDVLEWRVPTKDAGTVSGTATLRCTVGGYQTGDEDMEDEAAEADTNLLQGYYDPSTSYQDGTGMDPSVRRKRKTKKKKKTKKVSKSKHTSADPDQQQQAETQAEPSDPHLSIPQSPTPQQSSPLASSPLPPSSPNPTSPLPSSQLSSQSIFRPAPRKTKSQLNASLMPNSASVSFVVQGWLPSGIKVDSLSIDHRRSRGLGEGVRPYKGVKYLCVSRRGVEARC